MISVVAPVFNEEDSLLELRRRIVQSLEECRDDWELILVDDGSTDQTPQILHAMRSADPRIKIIELSRNFGQQGAVTAGMRSARGHCVVLIDGDLQDPPEVIPALVAEWKSGHQVVFGERRTRVEEGGLRGIGFRLFYPVMRRLTALPRAPNAGLFSLMDRAVVDEFNLLPERSRFIPGLRSWLGFNQARVLYDRGPRLAGKPKQTVGRLAEYALDAMFSFSYKPLRAATLLGVFVASCAFALGAFYVVTFFTMHKPVTGFTTIIVCVLFLGGVQLFFVGILGEYIGRIYEEAKQRPLYVVNRMVGFD